MAFNPQTGHRLQPPAVGRMPTISLDCALPIGGIGFFVEPPTDVMKRARIRKAIVHAGWTVAQTSLFVLGYLVFRRLRT